MKKLIAGNWKMNGSTAFSQEILTDVLSKIKIDSTVQNACDFLLFPPFPYISMVSELASGYLASGAQDCSIHKEGAYTGEVSAAMIVDCGAKYVLVGHSERRHYHHESDAMVAAKVKAAHEQGLIAMICVGETENQRDMGQEKVIVAQQLMKSIPDSTNAQNTVIAYEPVWAIGTGKTATPEDVREMHGFIREKLQERLADSQKMRILYGGSMKPENAAELLSIPNVDGGLIGGASLKADTFLAIAKAVR